MILLLLYTSYLSCLTFFLVTFVIGFFIILKLTPKNLPLLAFILSDICPSLIELFFYIFLKRKIKLIVNLSHLALTLTVISVSLNPLHAMGALESISHSQILQVLPKSLTCSQFNFQFNFLSLIFISFLDDWLERTKGFQWGFRRTGSWLKSAISMSRMGRSCPAQKVSPSLTSFLSQVGHRLPLCLG